MTGLSVPRRQVRIRLSSEGETIDGFVFVAEQSEHARGAQRVSELLNHPDLCLPVRDAATDRVYLYNKQSIVCLTLVEEQTRAWELEELEFSPAERIEVMLTSGQVLRGIAYLDPRPEKSRVSDLLNRPEEHFIVLVRDEGVTYVSKRHILRVG